MEAKIDAEKAGKTKMKFRAHETFFIRKGWLSKGMKYVVKDGEVFISKESNPMDVLGIGSNMVKSLRYWLQAVGLTEEAKSGRHVQSLTKFGRLVFENDRYTEEAGTLQLLHYKLASNKELATSWYVFFNDFSLSEFSQEDFVAHIQNWIKMNSDGDNTSGTTKTLGDDFSCICNTYIPRRKLNPDKVSPENNIDSPFGELGLLAPLREGKRNLLFRKTIPNISAFSPWVVLAVLQDQFKGAKEIQLQDILSAPGSLGRIFNLDSIAMIELLRKAEKIRELKIIRTAGLDVVQIARPERTFLDCAEEYYAGGSQRTKK